MLGWFTSGALFKTFSGQSQKGKGGSVEFRNEVATYARDYSIQDASAYSGLSEAEVKQCCAENSKASSSLFELLSPWTNTDSEVPLSRFVAKANPGLSLLEH